MAFSNDEHFYGLRPFPNSEVFMFLLTSEVEYFFLLLIYKLYQLIHLLV